MTICVLMCGGKGSRINAYSKISEKFTEKPLIIFKNKPLIEHIIETLMNSKKGFRIFAAVSSNTKETEALIKYKYYETVTILKTTGDGYSGDFTSIVSYFLTQSGIGELAKQSPQKNLFLRNQKQIIDCSKIIFLPIKFLFLFFKKVNSITEIPV